jgi:hypothetical protein
MLNTVKRVMVIAAIATTGIFAGAGTAHAAAQATGLSAVSSASTLTAPTSVIKGAGKTRKFVPNSVTAAPATGTCSSTNYSFLIHNSTMHTQTIMYLGAQLGSPIKSKQGLYVCAAGAGTGKLTLKGDVKAFLNFTIT